MKTQNKTSIDKNNTFDILDEIQEVKVSPFFKNKVLNQIREQKEEKVTLFTWFTPPLQLASLALILCLNILTILYAFEGDNNAQQQLSGIDAFVQDYSLDSEDTISIN